MHRSLISSGDFLDKLITLYPSAQHSRIETECFGPGFFFVLSPRQDCIISQALLHSAFLSLSTATGNQSGTCLMMPPVAVCAKYDWQVAVRVYACCQYIAICTRIHPSLWVLYLLTTITKLTLATSNLEEHVFYSIW